MKTEDVLEQLIEKFQELDYINFKAIEIDILKYAKECKKKANYDHQEVEDYLDTIYEKHFEKIKKIGYAKFGTRNIAQVYPPINFDSIDISAYNITQFDALMYLVKKFNSIVTKYFNTNSNVIGLSSENIEEDIHFIHNTFTIPLQLSSYILAFHKSINKVINDYEIRIAAATVSEIYIINSDMNKHENIVKGVIKKQAKSPIAIIDEKMIKDFEIFFNQVFKWVKNRQIELRGILDKDIAYDKKISAMTNSLRRIEYALKHHGEDIALKYLMQRNSKEILEELTKCDFNYLSKEQDSYELFEKFIIFIVETSSKKNKEEQIKDYKKIVKGAEKVKEGSSSFYGKQQDILKNYEDIKVGIKIGRNQILSASIDVFHFCYALDFKKIRDLLILFFSKAEETHVRKNTRMAIKKENFTFDYDEQLRYLIKNFLLEET